MDEYESLSHTTWDCKYHVVFIPARRRFAVGSSAPSFHVRRRCFAGHAEP